ncbi:MAG: hypothetical protein ACKOWK_06425 [Micrococcales bacterium]
MSRGVRRLKSDHGSALPIFLFGVIFLIVMSVVCLRAGQLLEAQRRINAATDSVALDLAMRLNGQAASEAQLTSWAIADIGEMYGAENLEIDAIESSSPGRASVRLCQQVSAERVCAQSTAEAR